MAKKDSFILYTEQKAVIDKLTDEQAGKLIKAIYEYVQNGEMPELDTVLDLVITPFKTVLDKDKESYERVCKARAEAGAKGGKQKKQMQTNESKDKQKKQMQTKDSKSDDNDNEYDNEYEYDNDNVTAKAVVSDSCVDGLQEVIDFYNNNIGVITPFGLEVLSSYAEEMSSDLIILAMKKSVEANIRTIQYIKGILNNWRKKGIKTVIEAENEDLVFRQKDEKQETEEEKLARKTRELEEALKNDKW